MTSFMANWVRRFQLWFRVKTLYRASVLASMLWLCMTIFLYQTANDLSIHSIWSSFAPTNISQEQLRVLMAANDVTVFTRWDPIAEMTIQNLGMLSFYHLPKRKSSILYTEVTSANRDTSYPLAPDFTFHVRYGEDSVVLYEDFGPGCIFRIYLFPSLPRDYDVIRRMTSADLKSSFLLFNIDGADFRYSVQQLMEANDWPFLYPINTRHAKPVSGIGTYVPICYEKYASVTYKHRENLPPNLFDVTVNCSRDDTLCPVHIYSAVSRHKYPVGTRVESFAQIASSMTGRQEHESLLNAAVDLLRQPGEHGPDRGERCLLKCVDFAGGRDDHLVYERRGSGVISALKVRVFDNVTGLLLPDWTSLLLTAYFDDSAQPQIDHVPLGSLFGATASLNEFIGAAVGRGRKFCAYENARLDLPSTAVTGYLYFPMPFWRSAKFYVSSARGAKTQLMCAQFSVVGNYYAEESTAYFHAAKTYYTDDVSGWRNVLAVNNSWGSVVALFLDVDNLRAVRNVPLSSRWAALQADAVLYIDGARSASVLGTGLEDYFSYSHGFAEAGNTTYSFVGVYHSTPKRAEPLTWHCYRLHVLDPIPFRNQIQFVMEGTGSRFQRPTRPISYAKHSERLRSGMTSLAHMVLYYARATPGASRADIFMLGDQASESAHRFKILRKSKSESGMTFRVHQKRYLAAVNADDTFNRTGRVFYPGDSFR